MAAAGGVACDVPGCGGVSYVGVCIVTDDSPFTSKCALCAISSKMSILQWKHSSVTVVRQEHRLLADLQFDQLTFKIVLLDYFVYDYVTLIFLMMNTAKQTFRQLDVYDVCQIFG